MRLVDVHAHLDFPPLNTMLGEVLERASNVGVKAIISNGTDPKSNRVVLDLAQKHPLIKPALGFYPTHIQNVDESEIDKELEFISQQKNVLALGEVGLDYKFAPEDNQKKTLSQEEKNTLFKKQKQGFEKIISLAEKKDLPLIVHSRKAEIDAIDMLQSSRVKNIIMHCFTGKKRLVKQIRENGWNFSLPVTLLKLQQFQELAQETPMNQLLTETDSPYLGPKIDEPNEPANVSLTVTKLAELKGQTPQETADQIFQNYMRIFL